MKIVAREPVANVEPEWKFFGNDELPGPSFEQSINWVYVSVAQEEVESNKYIMDPTGEVSKASEWSWKVMELRLSCIPSVSGGDLRSAPPVEGRFILCQCNIPLWYCKNDNAYLDIGQMLISLVADKLGAQRVRIGRIGDERKASGIS